MLVYTYGSRRVKKATKSHDLSPLQNYTFWTRGGIAHTQIFWERDIAMIVTSQVATSRRVLDWGYEHSEGYLLEAQSQQLSNKEGSFTHGDSGSCEPVAGTNEQGLYLPISSPSPGYHLTAYQASWVVATVTTDPDFADLILLPNLNTP